MDKHILSIKQARQRDNMSIWLQLWVDSKGSDFYCLLHLVGYGARAIGYRVVQAYCGHNSTATVNVSNEKGQRAAAGTVFII